MRENPAPDAKNRSHLDARRPEKISNITAFYREFPSYEEMGVSHDYLLGYLVHLLTDIYWKRDFFDGFKKRYEAAPAPVQDRSAAYYNDTDVADIQLYQTLPERREIWALLQKSRGYDLPGLVSGGEADKWNVRTLAWYEVPREYLSVRYATVESIQGYIGLAAKLIAAYLAENEV